MKPHPRVPFRPVVSLCLALFLPLVSTSWSQEEDDSAERKVMERFQSVLEKTPRRGTALDRVYGYHVEHGSLDSLVKRYEDRTKADAADGSSWLLLGLVEAQRGRDASAVAALREAERLRADDPLPSYYLGQALVLVGQPDTAVDAFERALTKKPSRTDLLEIYQALGRVHQRARRTDKALAVWARLEATFPDDNRVREQIAAALSEEDQPAQALVKYEALARDVKDEYRKVQFTIESAELKVRLGRSPEALADFERLLSRLDPGSWLFKEVRRKIEEVFLRGDDLAGLAKYYEGWIAKTPEDVDAMARLGKTYAQLGRAADSRRWLDQAVKLAPSRRDLRLALIEQLAQEKKFAEASAQYESLVKAEPGNPDLVRDWGRLLLRDSAKPEAERKAAASAVWKRLAGEEVKDAVAIAQGADLYRSAEMVDEAIALYKRAIALAPDAAQYREYLGEYYHQLKRPADALATWTGGTTRTAAEKGRLGEVLAGFGYRKEALGPLSEAVKLAPDDFDLRLRLSDNLVALDRPVDGLAELAAAGKLADAPEQAEAVLEREIHAYQAAKSLAQQIAILKGELDAGKDASAVRWTRLSRYYEADAKSNEAVLAASKATTSDPKSIVAWTTLGRLQEGSGNLGAAADANRKLATLDRRNRAEYLSSIARLEARLGRTQEALKAGRELLAAAPGNVEHHQEFAELCFNLGEIEEGLDALRRASRANPFDPKASNMLADALARQFRTEEAIELYWRAFDRTKDLDGRLGIVSRLADQYLQRNQFDRLISRLERELREPERKRELALCLAQAYQGAGDLGTARQQLESLLSANPRDSALLTQLSNLAEAEGDINAASRYLKMAIEIAPSPEGTARLGNLYLRSGEVSEAEDIWARLASADQDAGRAFSAIDSLMAAGKYETVLTLTERLLLKRPDDWDALYREGVALTNLGKTVEANRQFGKILELKANDDDLAAIPKSRKRGGSTTGPSGVQSARQAALYQFPVYMRRVATTQIRMVAKLEVLRVAATATVWTPADFGQSRMAALGWLYASSLKEKEPEAWAKARQADAEKPSAEPRALWDLYYLQLVKSLPREVFAATVRLARALPNDPAAQYAFLTALPGRDSNPNAVVRALPSSATDPTPPLSVDEQALVLNAFESLRARRSDLVQFSLLNSVLTELKRARRDSDADAIYKASIESASTLDSVSTVVGLAAERGDVDGLLAMLDKYDRLSSAANPSALSGSANVPYVSQISRAMGIKADDKDRDAVLRMLDHFLALTCRPDQVARRQKAKAGPSGAVSSNSYLLLTSRNTASRGVSIDFPTPNPYFDHPSILVLRNAFEIFKKDDLASDFIAHFRSQAAKLEGDAKLIPTLATSYLLWWNDEKDEALKEYVKASDMAHNDVELRLSLAELRAQRGEPLEALEAADSVEPLDQKTMQRRELLALRLAVMGGDVDRARKASERLFGLRLDADTQVQLATQMNQLGMHDLSEAVLARARRRSGGNSAALVSLMRQYQNQGKADVAVQVANQILRQTSGARISTTTPQTLAASQVDQYRAEAVQVFARSGKLKELIARAESQLETSPTSQQLLQTLVDYYQADGQRGKVKATYQKIAKLRPDDARLQLQVGVQLAQANAAAESLDYFRIALKKEPSLFAGQYSVIQRAFQQAGKSAELIKVYEEMDFKAFQSNPNFIRNTIRMLFQDASTRDQGLFLLRKAWKDLPDYRPSLLSSVNDTEVWKLPEIYDYAREAMIPPPGKPVANPWAGLDSVTLWGGNGTVTTPATQLLDAASRQGKLDSLAIEVEEAVTRSPDWSGGKALLAILKAQRGKVEEARAGLEPLTKQDASIPLYARMVISQELEKVEPLRDLAMTILEVTMAEKGNQTTLSITDFQFSPGWRLASLYKKAGRSRDARDLVLKVANATTDYSMYDANYAGYLKVEQNISIASLLGELGYPADAARVYSEVANDTQALEGLRQFYSGGQEPYTNQITTGLTKSLQEMDPETLARTLRTTLTPKPDAKPGEPRLDLVVLCHPRDLDKSSVTCLFAEAIKALKGQQDQKNQKALLAEVHATLERLVSTYPDDLSVLAASAILGGLGGDAGSVDRLVRLVDARPLDTLTNSARANARQREEATRQLLLWIVAREASKHDATRSGGEKLAMRALEASRRQLDNRWTLAMLREAGQDALDRGDRLSAEANMRAMLKMVMTTTTVSRPSKPTTASSTAPPPPAPPSPLGARQSDAGGFASSPGNSVITLERFEQVAQLAKLAAEHELTNVSIDALRDALAKGPPVTPLAIANANNSRSVVVRRTNGEPQLDLVAQKVEEHLFVLDAYWIKAKADPVAVYEVYREAVLPKARPSEIFLYARPLSMASMKLPRSVGALLVRWAVKAGKADELKAAIEARQASPLAIAPAKVLLAQLEFERKNYKETSRLLDSIREGLTKGGLAVTGEQACHAALPALEVKESAESASRVVESSIARIASTDQEEPAGSLLIRLARHELSNGRTAEGRKHLQEFLTRTEQATSRVRYSGDYALYIRRNQLARVAGEFAKGGQLDDALDLLGQYADAPISTDYGDSYNIASTLSQTLRMVALLPVEERYRRLKAWTFPTRDRKSVRWLVQAWSDFKLPAPFVTPKPIADRGLIGTPLLLIDAARELKQLDALAAELKPLAEAKVENAARLLVQVEIARGVGKEVVPIIRARLDEIGKPRQAGLQGRADQQAIVELADYHLARETLASPDPEVNAVGEEFAIRLDGMARSYSGIWVIGRTGRDLANYRARRAGAPGEASSTDPGLALWSARQVSTFTPEGDARDRAVWTESDGMVAHIAGNGGTDLLMSRYPLTGTFEFSVDAYSGAYAEATAGYGGLIAEPTPFFRQSGVHNLGNQDTVARPGVFARYDAFNRITIRVEPGKVTYLVNGHLFYEDTKGTATSPWLILYAPSQRHTAFRNATLTGHPEIPREVALSGGDGLDGWDSSSYFESIPPGRSMGKLARSSRQENVPTKPGDFDWHAFDGEIRGRHAASSAVGTTDRIYYSPGISDEPPAANDPRPSRLAYHRPLSDGDSIAYEFFYQPGETMVHPAVGHLAFLVEPEGVRLHALVPLGDGIGNVGPSNVLEDPAGRRDAVALKPGGWNAATIRLKGATLALEVNGKLVYERDLDSDDDRIFSLYHDRAATAARARNLVLRGNWPKDLTPEQLATPFVRSGAEGDWSARRARSAMIGEPFLVLSAGDIARAARKLPAPERYARLLAWVLPGLDHASVRLAGEFGPTDSPVVSSETKGPERSGIPPALDCPAIDLVASATEADKLDELAAAIDAAEASTSVDRRGKFALLTLVRDAQGKTTEAEAALKALKDQARASIVKQTSDHERWPELIVGSALAARPALNLASRALLDDAVDMIQRDFYAGALERPIRHARGIAHLLAEKADQSINPREWVPATLGTAETRGRGNPLPAWNHSDGVWHHTPGHNVDLLFLATPLRGDFELTCDVTSFNWREARISYSGTSIGLNWNLKEYEVQRYGRWTEANGLINPPIKDVGEWYPFRLAVQGGRMTTYAQGRKLDERAITGEADPWLALVASGALTTGVRNLKIVGNPTIPDRIVLSNSSDLTGWLGDYYGEATQGEDAAWRKRGDEIIGRKLSTEAKTIVDNEYGNNPPKLAETIIGSKHESVLRYARPVAEDGEITYEFYHEPGKAIVHPSLDRLAFLLEPDGVRLHRISDGKHDRTGLDPGNATNDPSSRRGPVRLPLKAGEWNRMALAIRGDELTLTLNGEAIFVRKLEATNRRDFGLFYFADESEARIRDVVYKGEWPRTLPAEVVQGPAK
jgi:tetratricopeptide (TPR) repeat protein